MRAITAIMLAATLHAQAAVSYTPQLGDPSVASFSARNLPQVGTTFMIQTNVPCATSDTNTCIHTMIVSPSALPNGWIMLKINGYFSELLIWPIYYERQFTTNPINWLIFRFPIPSDPALIGTNAYFQLYGESCKQDGLLTDRMNVTIGV